MITLSPHDVQPSGYWPAGQGVDGLRDVFDGGVSKMSSASSTASSVTKNLSPASKRNHCVNNPPATIIHRNQLEIMCMPAKVIRMIPQITTIRQIAGLYRRMACRVPLRRMKTVVTIADGCGRAPPPCA